MNHAPHRLQGVPEINLAHIGKAFADGRAYRRLTGPAVHKRIPERRFGFPPPINWLDLFAKAIIVAGAGVCVAMWTGVVS